MIEGDKVRINNVTGMENREFIGQTGKIIAVGNPGLCCVKVDGTTTILDLHSKQIEALGRDAPSALAD
jgi:hypothetical protein|tara:strand:+ start:1040 stop:1243 length:204 start_codon:yes stop_codon:yes gene_type:complete